MSLNSDRIAYVKEYDFSHVGWRSAVKKMINRAAVRAGERGVLNVKRDAFMKKTLGDEYNPRYASHMLTDCNRVEGVTFATVGVGASARLVIVFDDEKIRKSLEEKKE
nr:MAG TPA: hypothetical protein [Caudoviricetes sp.]